MSESNSVPVVAALPGWYTLDAADAHLIGSRCAGCGTYYFPRLKTYCRNPDCDSESFDDVELSRTGKLWSYTNASYQPPPPYVAAEPFKPFGIVAVELDRERMIVLGQLVEGVDSATLQVGQAMELTLQSLADGKVIWAWRPAT